MQQIATITRLGAWLTLLTGALFACKDEFLAEKPEAFFSPEITLINKAGFESAINALHTGARDEVGGEDGKGTIYAMQFGTDIAATGELNFFDFQDYETTQTPTYSAVNYYWSWAYRTMIPRANAIIDYAQRPTAVWANETEKNAILAEACFFRAYAHNVLVNLYGGVPIVDVYYETPRFDFVRATKEQTLDFIRRDLEFASQWLPKTTTQEGRIVKAAADHLLTEVYINLKDYDKAIASASAVISDGQYKLMTTRFGAQRGNSGDVFSDLFQPGNINRKSGNQETIWALQVEYNVPGGTGGAVNNQLRAWGPAYWRAKDPAGSNGMVIVDTLGRSVGWIRPTNYFVYQLWINDLQDMRNSRFNIRREWYYNNPSSKFYRQKVTYHTNLDTLQDIYPTIRKVEGDALLGATSGRTTKDIYRMRLAETYLLRAEAHLRKGDRQKAADDINVVRSRANANLATAADMTLDYMLDERARELITEEPRRRTLIRFGNLVERVKKFNFRTKNRISEKHGLFPIPQSAIDANSGAKLEQNPGY